MHRRRAGAGPHRCIGSRLRERYTCLAGSLAAKVGALRVYQLPMAISEGGSNRIVGMQESRPILATQVLAELELDRTRRTDFLHRRASSGITLHYKVTGGRGEARGKNETCASCCDPDIDLYRGDMRSRPDTGRGITA